MAEATNRIIYIVEASQAQAEAQKLSGSLDGVGKAAQSSAATSTAAMNTVSKATTGAAVSAQQLQQVYQNVVRTQGANSVAAKELAAAMGLTAQATTATATAHKAVEAATNTAAEGFNRLTTRISVGRGVLSGYDAAIEGVVRAMGGISLGWSVAIGLVSTLLPKIIELSSAKQEQIKIDKAQIEADLERADSTQRTIKLNSDLLTAVSILAREQSSYEKKTRELRETQDQLTKGPITQWYYTQEGATQRVTASAQDLIDKSNTLNKEISEQEKVMRPAVDTILEYQRALGVSNDQLIEWLKTMHKSPEEIEAVMNALQALTPVINTVGVELLKLRVPKLEISATFPGIEALRGAVQDAFQKARDLGITEWKDQIRVAGPALKALDEGIRHHSDTLAEYQAQIAKLQPYEQEALRVWKEQQKAQKENFDTQKKMTDAFPQLLDELFRKRMELAKDDFAAQRKIVEDQFAWRRDQLRREGKLTEEASLTLKAIELRTFEEITAKEIDYYKKRDDNRRRDIEDQIRHLEQQRAVREREVAELRTHLSRQRQVREDAERRRQEDEEKHEAERRRNRAGRAQQEEEEIRRQNELRDRAAATFGRISQNADLAARQIDAMNGKLSAQQNILVSLQSSWDDFMEDWIRSGEIFRRVGDMIGTALENMTARGEDFGKNMKAMFLDLVADLASYFGDLFIKMGAGYLFISPWVGVGLIAAGVGLKALAGYFRGLASKAHEAATASGSAAGGGATSAAGGGAAAAAVNPAIPPNVIPFPTSGPAGDVHIHLGSGEGEKFLKNVFEGHGVVTMDSIRGKHNRAIKKAIA